MDDTGPLEIDVAALPRVEPLAPDDMDAETRAIWDASDLSSPGSDSLIGIWLWNRELAQVRSPFVHHVKNSDCLPLRHRELAILRTAWKTGCDYIWARHSDIGSSYGLTGEEIERVAVGPGDPAWTEDEAAVLRAMDELHDHSRISDRTWADLAGMYDKAQLLELCNLAGTYHIMAYTMGAIGMRPPYGAGTSPDLPGNRFLFARSETSPHGALADALTSAFATRDVDAFWGLLASDARWGDDESPNKCRCREDVVRTFKRLLAEGVRGRIEETFTGPRGVAAKLTVQWPDADEHTHHETLFHVYVVNDGKIVEIQRHDDRSSAMAAISR